MDNKKTNGLKFDMTFNNVPIHIAKEFRKDMNKYGNIYWVKLMSLMQKAEAYDFLLAQQGYAEEFVEQEDIIEKDKFGKPKEDKNVIKTFTGEVDA